MKANSKVLKPTIWRHRSSNLLYLFIDLFKILSWYGWQQHQIAPPLSPQIAVSINICAQHSVHCPLCCAMTLPSKDEKMYQEIRMCEQLSSNSSGQFTYWQFLRWKLAQRIQYGHKRSLRKDWKTIRFVILTPQTEFYQVLQ